MNKEWLNIAETAEYLGVHYDTARKAIQEGKLPSARISGIGVRVRKAALEKFLTDREVPARR
jgi:excisionase family DNA binding protein